MPTVTTYFKENGSLIVKNIDVRISGAHLPNVLAWFNTETVKCVAVVYYYKEDNIILIIE